MKLISDRLLRQRISKIERALVINMWILYCWKSHFSHQELKTLAKMYIYKNWQKITNFQIPSSLLFSSTVTEWKAEDLGIWKAEKDRSMLAWKIDQMKDLSFAPLVSRLFTHQKSVIIHLLTMYNCTIVQFPVPKYISEFLKNITPTLFYIMKSSEFIQWGKKITKVTFSFVSLICREWCQLFPLKRVTLCVVIKILLCEIAILEIA